MCNRYRMTDSRRAWLAAMGVVAPPPEYDRLPPPELFPKRLAWTVRQRGTDRIAEPMVWGFPPPAAGRAPVTNVRNLASPFWRSALANPERRCLVPVTAFCEWEGGATPKIARWFSVPSLPVFAFAGIWRPLDDGTAAFAFLTCEPNALVAPIHPKAMPVVLHPEDHTRWLTAPIADAQTVAAPFPSQLMAIDPA